MARSKILVWVALVCLSTVPTLYAQGTADAAVRTVFQGLEQNHAEALWQALPTSYQADVTQVVHGLASNADPELWNGSFRVVAKLARVLDEKRAYIQQHPMVAAKMSEMPGSSAGYDSVVRVLQTLAGSDLADVSKVRSLNVESFLAGTVSQLMAQLKELAPLSPGSAESLESLGESKVSLVSQKGDHAVVRIVSGDKSEDKEMVRVEGKWIPAEMAEGWKDKVAEIQAELAQLPSSQGTEQSAQFLAVLGPLETTLDQLLATETEEQFNAAVQQLVGMVMMQFMGGANEGQEQSQ